MRRSLILLPCVAILALPGVWDSSQTRADVPTSQSGAKMDPLLPASVSPARHTDFHYRFVTYLPDDHLLALFDADEGRIDDEVDDKLILIDDGEEQTNPNEQTKAATIDDLRPENKVIGDGDTVIGDGDTAARVEQAVESATAGEDIGTSEEKWSDRARLAMRLAELNKPAALLTISVPPPQIGDTPVNQAAEIFDEAPYWIRGHEGFAPPARRVHMAFYHNPTYYQELNLERCGQLDCERYGYLQNLYSSVWFIGNTSLLPYRLASQPPCDCVLSYGDCPTCHDYYCPLEPLQFGESCAPTRRGLLSQSAALAGFVLLLW